MTGTLLLRPKKNYKLHLKKISKLYKQYIKDSRKKIDYDIILDMTKNITAEISDSKKNYFHNLTEKLFNPKMNQKAGWGNFKHFSTRKKLQLHHLRS